jgi:hypothetical protein
MTDDIARLLALAGRPTPVIQEGVALAGDLELAAFAVACAEEFEAAPVHDPAADKLWTILKRHTIDTLMPRIKGSGIKIEYTTDDPYMEFGKSPKMMIRAMLYDILINKRLLIYSGEDSPHPNFTTEENYIFRTIHDYMTHGKLLSTFKANLLKVHPGIAQGERPSPEELAKALPQVSITKGGNMGHALTARGELNAVSAHIRLAPKAAAPALFTEVAGQICYFMCTGKFVPQQKVAILPGFDYQKIGQTIPGSRADARKAEVLAFLQKAGPDDMLKMHLAARPEVKVSRLLKNVNSHDPLGNG